MRDYHIAEKWSLDEDGNLVVKKISYEEFYKQPTRWERFKFWIKGIFK